MRVCIHTAWDVRRNFIGGTERFIVELSTELKKLGFTPFIVCTGDETEQFIGGIPVYGTAPHYGRVFRSLGEAKVPFMRQAFGFSNNMESTMKRFASYVKAQVQQFDFDILHLNSFASSIDLDTGKKIIATNHEMPREFDNIWGPHAYDTFAKQIWPYRKPIDSLVVPSAYYANFFSKSLMANVVSVNQGVNLDTFSKAPINSLNKKKPNVQILIPSRIEPYQKGQDLAIAALRKLCESGRNVSMTFSGVRKDASENVDQLRKLAHSQGVLDRVVFKSFH